MLEREEGFLGEGMSRERTPRKRTFHSDLEFPRVERHPSPCTPDQWAEETDTGLSASAKGYGSSEAPTCQPGTIAVLLTRTRSCVQGPGANV